MDDRIDLTGRVAVVTGAGRGLGRAYAEGLAKAGAAVVVNDLDEAVATEAVEAIRGAGGQAVAHVAAVGPTAAAEELVERAVAEFGRLDVMCTNAGALRDRTLLKMSDEDFDVVVDSHLRGTFTCGRAAARRFREQGEGGRLILVGSPAGQLGAFGQTAYAASKAAIIALVRVWSVELAKYGITVNAVVPKALTRMAATIPALTEVVAQVEAGAPVPEHLRRQGTGTVEDVVPLVVFLSSAAAAGITGQYIGFGGDRLSVWAHPTEAFVTHRDGGWSAEQLAADFAGWTEHLQDHTRKPG
ncbi:3-oxoacyl-[acyl-carrier protein] reductase [Pseudonocardia thermophila]|mgnify:CR=1 FL=1|jgi:Dehydrogenases with different specificities (related to short-chain alcohol dehydrogenases)|uniref:3-oxoacyl-[acyl-carrier protein] reductase n=1 Tax=Pseudonocardia thermophila TaxID=1848 RepID=A0A1M6XZ83_PSETH|nr:SDR family oxidoreductase [Pseudonocardia thermophila]SHL11236.1 3-oxoacyl-[acyl-carrier protein] reductase [Pseudonocardia thermophila]